MSQTLITILLTAALTIAGNILYFEYKAKREFDRQVLKERLIKFLLPLFYTLEKDDFVFQGLVNRLNGDPWEYDAEKFKRLLEKLEKIISENLYLADDQLQAACLDFLEDALATDSEERFLLLMENEKEDVAGKKLEKFKSLISVLYNETRRRYLRSK